MARIPAIKCQTQTRAAGIGHCMGAPSGHGASARQYKQNENDMLQFEGYYECLTNGNQSEVRLNGNDRRQE